MKPITLPMAELKPALVGLAKVINKHRTLPILTAVKIQRTSEGWITLTASDLDTCVTVRLEQPANGEPISLVVPYDELLKTANRCAKDDAISLRTQKDASDPSVILTYPVGKQFAENRCESYPVEDFPPIPRIRGESVPVNEHLQQTIHEAMDCASVDPTRFVLNGVFIDVSDKKCNHVVATDGSHLYASNSFSLPLKDSILIPDHKFLSWKGFKTDGEWQLRVSSDASDVKKPLLQISSRRWRFITNQVEGTFPNWRHVIPSEFKTTIHLHGEVLDSAVEIVERIPYDAKNADKAICLRVDRNKLTVRGRNKNDRNWTDVEVPGAKITGPPVDIHLNRDFALKAFKFGLDQIEIQDGTSPLRFSNGGKQMIVMPVRVVEPPKPVVPPSPEESPVAEASTPPPPIEVNERKIITVNQNSRSEIENRPALETALEQVEELKEAMKINIGNVNSILGSLKTAQREQKVTQRDYSSIRSTLKSLQSVRI